MNGVGALPADEFPVPEDVRARVDAVVTAARRAVRDLAVAPRGAIDEFYERAWVMLGEDRVVDELERANRADVESARSRGRPIGRLRLDERMLRAMRDGLRQLAAVGDRRDEVLERHEHGRFTVEVLRSALGVVGFVFEGRPNVLLDATGVLSVGNAAVLRIGSDALRTARALESAVVRPALRSAGLPEDAVGVLDEPSHAAGWALFSHGDVALAVARGSGSAVRDLGRVARTHGIPVSLHGTGGAWMIVDRDADPERVEQVVAASLDRKVCNTLNVCCVPADVRLLSAVLDGVVRASGPARAIVHADEDVRALAADRGDLEWAAPAPLQVEWEWEERIECSVVICEVDEAVESCNLHSPRFVVSVIGGPSSLERLWPRLDAPFVGDGMTRWVDGQYALSRPELGLSNWEQGRGLARGSILSGVDVHTLRYRMRQSDPGLAR